MIFNKLLDQNLQYLLILSYLTANDPELSTKVTGIAKKFDQFHAVIRLLDIYESSAFQRTIFPVNRDIRDRSVPQAKAVFDRELIRNLEESEAVRTGEVRTMEDLFTFERFRGVRNRWVNFSKYVLMRVDRYLAEQLDKPSYASGPLEDLEEHFNRTTRRRYGMHLEHIYANNEANMALSLKVSTDLTNKLSIQSATS